MFDNFPYTDMHQLNLDWIIKIAKDFLDQYTHIQQLISDGEASLQNLTEEGLQQLQDKADNLETLLQEWYNTHSEDIAQELAAALEDINELLSSSLANINELVDTSLASITTNTNNAIDRFNSSADIKAQETIASIPDDYTALANAVTQITAEVDALVGLPTVINLLDNNNNTYTQFEIIAGKHYAFKNTSAAGPVAIWTWTSNTSSGQTIETVTSNLGVNRIVYFNAAANASYIRVFHDITGGAGQIEITDMDSVLNQLANIFNDETTYNLAAANNNTWIPYTIESGKSYIIINTCASGAIAAYTTNADGSTSNIETISTQTLPNFSVKFTAREDASYIRIFHNINYGTGSVIIYNADTMEQKVNEIYKYLFNKTTKFDCEVANNNTYVFYLMEKDKEYLIKNTSANGNIAVWQWSSSDSSGSAIETLVSNLAAGNDVRIISEHDTSYIRIFHNIESGSGSVEITYAETIEQKLKELENPPTTTGLLAWGDSLTAGAGGATTYPEECARALGIPYVLNCGVGGERANTIACRQGGDMFIIPAGSINGTYSNFKDLFGDTITPLLQGDGGGSASKIYINNEECSISYNNSTYTISGYTGGPSNVPLYARFLGSEYSGKITTIFVGTNGVYVDGESGVDPYITVIDSMIKHCNNNQYVILGLSTGTTAERESVDNRYLKEYGNKFFPTRKMLVEYGLDIMEIVPTQQDIQDMNVGRVPESLRSDAVHLNTSGYTALGKLLADFIRGLGYKY